jgi:hypothetical protein
MPHQAVGRSNDQTSSEEYRQALGNSPKLSNQERSFIAYGFNAMRNATGNNQNPSSLISSDLNKRNTEPSGNFFNVNVAPNPAADVQQETPEIRKYRKKFNSDILCASLWGVNLLIGTENSLMLLDRSGQGKVYPLITRRRFQQMEVLESINILVTISGKKNKIRVYYLSWLKNKIVKTESVRFN